MDAEIVDNPHRRRFEAWVGDERVGSAHYRVRDGRIVFTHTEVDDAYEGEGIGSQLASAALDMVRERDALAVPLCPFIDSYIRRHAEYGDIVDEEMTESLRNRSEP